MPHLVQSSWFRSLCIALFLSIPATARSQALPTASRAGDLQVGGGYSSANADYEYVHNRLAGLYLYTDFDLRSHLGVEASFHQVADPHSAVYQRTFELGARYVRHYALGKIGIHPSAALQGGLGVLNFPKYANLGYGLLAGTGAVDVSIHPRINLRAAFEYQHWFSAPGAELSLNPSLISVGAAYHFDGARPNFRRH